MQASVLVVDDEELIRWSLQKELITKGYAVTTAASQREALAAFEADPADVVLLDVKLPDGSGLELIPAFLALRDGVSIIMTTSVTSLDTAVEAMRLGASDYVTKPFDFPKLWNAVARSVERVTLRAENQTLRSRDRRARAVIVAESPGMKHTLELAAKLRTNDAVTVLLLGESGVGKDLLARHIHVSSGRGDKLFVDLNCASLPEALLESELFGHERGAFTDAKTQKRGLFEVASGGTVYLDEIGDAPPLVQAKLLKVLEQRTFRRVGGIRDLVSDARVIGATNQDLNKAVAEKRFREDLFYRLSVFPIEIAPLRDRREDILPLATLFLTNLDRNRRSAARSFEPEVRELLLNYRWPGNVRELRNVIERAVILAGDAPVSADLLPVEISETRDPLRTPDASGSLAGQEARLIRETLVQCRGNQTRAAQKLGIGRDALRRRMHRLGIAPGGEEPQ